MTVSYNRTLPSGLKLAEHVAAMLPRIDEAATIKALADEMIKWEGSATNKAMLEAGYAGTVGEFTIDQSAGASGGNVSVGQVYTGDTSLSLIHI